MELLWRAILRVGRQDGEISIRRRDGSQVSSHYMATTNVIPGEHVSPAREDLEQPPPPTTLRQAKTFVNNSGLLMLGTLMALVWANLERESYVRFAQSLHFVVNDIGMAFFFALAAKEVTEATAPGGALHSPRRAAMPLAAAVGGMLGPALIFVTMTIVLDRPNLERGWAIPTATDIAFSYLAARIIFGAKHPAIPFLLLLAIADDAIGLLIIAAFYPTGPLRLIDLTVLLGAGMLVAWWLQKRRVVSFWPYILGRRAVVDRFLSRRRASGARPGAYNSVSPARRARPGVVRRSARRARHARRVRASVQAAGRRDAVFLRPRQRGRRLRQRRRGHVVRAALDHHRQTRSASPTTVVYASAGLRLPRTSRGGT